MLAALISVSLLLLSAPAHGFWILSHHPLTAQRLDPIISGSNPSGHTHNFVGSADLLGNSQNTSCTTSEVKDDRSRYWAPQLYSYSTTNGFTAVPLSFVNTYYLNRGDNLTAFPYGLRMIAGSAKNYDAPLADPTSAKAISFVCLNFNSGSNQTQTMPTGPCPDGLRTQIIFPSCWNGVDLDSSDHQSHMSYPTGGFPDNGPCPATHPVKTMTLFYEFIWSTNGFVTNSTNSLVLANGDTLGYSFHADFISGWNVTTLQNAANQCTGQLFGDLQSCPPFVPSYKAETQGSSYCTTPPILHENVVGPNLASMPGCNYIHNGPFAGAGKSDPACGGNGTASPTTPSTYQGCFQEPSGNRALPNRVSTPNGNSAAACQAACTAAGYSIAGTEYSDECWCGNVLTGGTLQVSDSQCTMSCSGDSSQFCGGPNLLSVYSASNVTIASPPSQPSTIGNYSLFGCVYDNPSSRTLYGASPSLGGQNTLEACAAACSGYKYFGTEYSRECYCGNTLRAGFSTQDASQCSMTCSGNSSEYCGAGNRLSVYSLTSGSPTSTTSSVQSSAAPTSSSTSSAVSSTSAASTTSSSSTSSTSISSSSASTPSASSPAGFSALGCYVDNTGGRTLPTLAYSNGQNTPAACTAACRAKGLRYSGIEYGAECYCGNTILNAGATSGTNQAGCTMACSGDGKQLCGGPNRINIYQDTTWKQSLFTVKSSGQWNFTDCYVDVVQRRALNVTLSVASSTMTVESCLKACASKNLQLCGMEYSGECYGTQSASTSSLQRAPVPQNGAGTDPISRGCSMPCNGNKTETCGGPSRLNVFTFMPSWSASSPTTVM